MTAIGLDGVVAAETLMSLVDGQNGRLVIRGRELADLVAHDGFEGAAALLWQAVADPAPTRAAVVAGLGAARVTAWAQVPRFLAAARGKAPIDALMLGATLVDEAGEAPVEWRLTAALPVFLAALLRDRDGLAPVEPDAGLGHAADIMRMIRGKAVTADEAAGLDAYITTVIDHGLNASTFAARVIASTQAGLVAAVAGGIGALKGPLHGGAPGPVLDMLDAVGSPENATAWLSAALERGERLMGFGHRIYRVRDPRADMLKAAVRRLDPAAGRIRLAEAVEGAALALLADRYRNRTLETNVEFYTALLLDALGLPRDAFTAMFAVGRVAGWTAHALEQARGGRLIRPESRYVGPLAA